MAIMQQAEISWIQVPAAAKYFLFAINVQTGSGSHPVSYSTGTWVISQR